MDMKSSILLQSKMFNPMESTNRLIKKRIYAWDVLVKSGLLAQIKRTNGS
jgi:hypothetical protein